MWVKKKIKELEKELETVEVKNKGKRYKVSDFRCQVSGKLKTILLLQKAIELESDECIV